MVYVVKWTENGKNGLPVKRQISTEYKPLALVLFNRIIVDCQHYDAVLKTRNR